MGKLSHSYRGPVAALLPAGLLAPTRQEPHTRRGSPTPGLRQLSALMGPWGDTRPGTQHGAGAGTALAFHLQDCGSEPGSCCPSGCPCPSCRTGPGSSARDKPGPAQPWQEPSTGVGTALSLQQSAAAARGCAGVPPAEGLPPPASAGTRLGTSPHCTQGPPRGCHLLSACLGARGCHSPSSRMPQSLPCPLPVSPTQNPSSSCGISFPPGCL